MKFSLWTQYGARNSVPVFEAFKKSVEDIGHVAVENDSSDDVDVNVIWSVLWSGRMALNKEIFYDSKPTIVLEVGSIQRGNTWKMCINGIGQQHCIATAGNSHARAVLLGLELKPWRQNGDYILICCQNTRSQLWEHMPSASTWVNRTVNTIRKHTDMPIVVRPHPRSPLTGPLSKHKNVKVQVPKKVPGTYDCYDLDFTGAHAVVSWNASSGPLAAIAGIPVFTGMYSLAEPVANLNLENINNPMMPDRTQWLSDFAHTEYTLHEIRQGIPLLKLLNRLDLLVKR